MCPQCDAKRVGMKAQYHGNVIQQVVEMGELRGMQWPAILWKGADTSTVREVTETVV